MFLRILKIFINVSSFKISINRKTFKVLILISGLLGFHGFDLQCRFKQMNSAYGGKVYDSGCRTVNVKIKSQDQIISNVNGESVKSFNGSDQKIIYSTEQTFNYFPSNLGEIFPDIEEIWIESSMLKEITRKDLAQFPKLTRLYLNYNSIQILPGDLFQDNPALEKISFNYNSLKFVGENILSPLKNLEYASFSYCGCINMGYSDKNLMEILNSNLRSDCFDQLAQDLIDQNEIVQKEMNKLREQIQNCNAIISSTVSYFTTFLQDPDNFPKMHLDLFCKHDPKDSSCKVRDLEVNVIGQKINKVNDERNDLAKV